MSKVKYLAIVLAIMMIPSVCFAEGSPWKQYDTTSEQIYRKLDFGAKNLLGGWTEIITVTADHQKNGQSFFRGLAQGTMNAVVYTVGGVLHTATFFIPQIDVKLPNDGVQFK